MANSFTAVIPQLLAQGVMALRENIVTARLTNRQYEPMAGPEGSTIDVPIPAAITVQQVSPSNTPPSTADTTPTSVAITLDQWWEAPFYLTDKELLEVQAGTIPMVASEAVKALANKIDNYILTQAMNAAYGYVGTPGTTPFGGATPSANDAIDLKKKLDDQLCPVGDRFVVMNTAAEAAALKVPEFQRMDFSGSVQAILEGNLNRKLGFQWFANQNLPDHTEGTLDDGGAAPVMTCLINDASVTVGQKTVACDETSLTGTVVVGDKFTVAGDTQQYVITAGATAAANAITLAFEPGAKVAWADDAAVTFAEAAAEANVHTQNVAFHRSAIAFASRPLEAVGDPGNSQSFADPVSGVVLRLERTREHKRWRYSYDALWGAGVPRRELVAVLMG